MKSKKLSLTLVLFVTFALTVTAVLSGAFFAPTHSAFADAGNYYSKITATSGTPLLGQLHDLIVETHKTYTSYDDCKRYGPTTDPGLDGRGVIEFYTHETILSAGTNLGQWNREHVWCKSLSNKLWGTGGGGSDLHHIRPTESGLNSIRGNNKYGIVSGGKEAWSRDTNKNNSKLGGHVGGGIFEPMDNVKGDAARIVMYVYTHYNNASNVGGTKECEKAHGNLPITNVIQASSESAAWKMLLEWNKLDPVDNIERHRNEEVYKIQGNRNPFIDNETYADAIWGDGTTEPPSNELKSLTMNVSSLNLNVGGTSALSVTATPSAANKSVTWSSDNANVAKVEQSGNVTAVSVGTATITATSVENANIKATATVTVKEVTDIVISGTPSKLNYTAGSAFDPTGLTVKAVYSGGTESPLALTDVLWLDADTDKPVMLETTTKIKCKYGSIEKTLDITVTVAANPNTSNFISSVAAIGQAATLQIKFNAIRQALADYNSLSAAEKQEVAGAYQSLQDYIAEYNQSASDQNAEMNKAASIMGDALVKTLPALLAIAYIITRKMY